MERRIALSLVSAVATALSGCATTTADVRPIAALAQAQLHRYRALQIQVTHAQGVATDAAATGRIGRRVVEAVRTRAPRRFAAIEAGARPAGNSTLRATVELTRYEEGSAFARAMLAGLGQMHVDAQVILTDPATGAALGAFEVRKTFAWGGAYGAGTRIEDVELGFAGGVADAILAGTGSWATVAAVPSAPRAPSSRPAVCSHDLDCAGKSICVQGRCVAPLRPTTIAAAEQLDPRPTIAPPSLAPEAALSLSVEPDRDPRYQAAKRAHRRGVLLASIGGSLGVLVGFSVIWASQSPESSATPTERRLMAAAGASIGAGGIASLAIGIPLAVSANRRMRGVRESLRLAPQVVAGGAGLMVSGQLW